MMDAAYCAAGAHVSSCGQYRYRLWREWRLGHSTQWEMWTEDDGSPCLDGAGQQIGEPRSCVFVMLNPSTADANDDDPTIRRCVGFAKAWGYDRLEVVNLFAWRSTEPKTILGMGGRDTPDPVGIDNQDELQSAIFRTGGGAGIIVCAWGAHGGHLGQDETVLGWIEDAIDLAEREIPVVALQLTKDGYPAHPLYLKKDLTPFPYRGRPLQ